MFPFFEFWLYTHSFKYNKKYSNDCKFFLSSLHKPLHCLSMLDKPIEFSFTTTGNIPKFPFVILEWKFPKNAALMNCRWTKVKSSGNNESQSSLSSAIEEKYRKSTVLFLLVVNLIMFVCIGSAFSYSNTSQIWCSSKHLANGLDWVISTLLHKEHLKSRALILVSLQVHRSIWIKEV